MDWGERSMLACGSKPALVACRSPFSYFSNFSSHFAHAIMDLSGLLAGDLSDPQVVVEHEATSQAEPFEELDFDLAPSQVVDRIEACAAWMAHQIIQGIVPEIAIPAAYSSPTAQSLTLSLVGRHAESAERFARLWAILDACHELLSSSAVATQRDLHYRLKPRGSTFRTQAHFSQALQDAVRLLRVPRSSLGVNCSSKGLVSGHLMIRDTATGAVTDCSTAPGGVAISGDITVVSRLEFSTTASICVVIEKDTVFQNLAVDGALMGTGQVIVVTGKGVPDVATRAFLSALCCAHPHLVCVGLVDWNPAGVGILSMYRFGSRRMAESARYVLPALKWLGARSGMLGAAAGDAFHELGPRDSALIPGLRSTLAQDASAWVRELDAMQSAGVKADIEALYTCSSCGGAAGLGRLLAEHIARCDWV